MKEIHHGYGLYLKLKETLDAEQTALLVKLSDQHLSDEENAFAFLLNLGILWHNGKRS